MLRNPVSVLCKWPRYCRIDMLVCVTSVTALLFLSISHCIYIPYSVTQTVAACVTVCVTPGCLRHSCVTVEEFCVTETSFVNNGLVESVTQRDGCDAKVHTYSKTPRSSRCHPAPGLAAAWCWRGQEGAELYAVVSPGWSTRLCAWRFPVHVDN